MPEHVTLAKQNITTTTTHSHITHKAVYSADIDSAIFSFKWLSVLESSTHIFHILYSCMEYCPLQYLMKFFTRVRTCNSYSSPPTSNDIFAKFLAICRGRWRWPLATMLSKEAIKKDHKKIENSVPSARDFAAQEPLLCIDTVCHCCYQ